MPRAVRHVSSRPRCHGAGASGHDPGCISREGYHLLTSITIARPREGPASAQLASLNPQSGTWAQAAPRPAASRVREYRELQVLSESQAPLVYRSESAAAGGQDR